MPVGFDQFMAKALYGPGGFYATGRGAGRRRDFITSPELGPLFGTVVAHALDLWWEELGRPDPFVVIEAAAGRGVLRDAITASATAPISYVEVEFADDWPARGDVIIANELLDNLPFKIAERVGGQWLELLVDDGRFVPGEPIELDLTAPDGSRVPVHTAARDWMDRAKRTARRIVMVDYGRPTTSELIGRQWLRTYREHDRGFDPLREPGTRDITTDVGFDQLAPDRLTTQADWLRAHGIDALVEQAKATWHERAAIGDLAALKARARVNEAAALLDPHELGAFLVAEWLPRTAEHRNSVEGYGRL
jgi:SAM-dependent MidA family methyltransferase